MKQGRCIWKINQGKPTEKICNRPADETGYCKTHAKAIEKKREIEELAKQKLQQINPKYEPPSTIIRDSQGNIVTVLPPPPKISNPTQQPKPTLDLMPPQPPIMKELQPPNTPKNPETPRNIKLPEIESIEQPRDPHDPQTHRISVNKEEPIETSRVDAPETTRMEGQEKVETIPLLPFIIPEEPKQQQGNQELTPEEEQERKEEQLAEQQIRSYYKALPWLQKEFPYQLRGEMTAREFIKQLNSYISGRQADIICKHGFSAISGAIEAIGCRLGAKVQGFRKTITELDEVNELLKIIRIRNEHLFGEISPEMKLLGVMGFTLMTLDSINKSKDASIPWSSSRTDPPNNINKQVNPEINRIQPSYNE
jgi:hypothetical protein